MPLPSTEGTQSGSEPDCVPRLSLRGLGKSYGDNTVLSDITLSIGRGEVVGLIGENGAGKSTLLNILSGVVRADRGDVESDGHGVRPSSYRDAQRAGFFRVFQDSALVANLTVRQNMYFGWESKVGRGPSLLRRRRAIAATRAALDRVGVGAVDTEAVVSSLSPGVRQAVEIARAIELAHLLEIEHPVVLFDEPTTALDAVNEDNFLTLVRHLRGKATVVLVSHRLGDLLATCDRILVLKDGTVVDDAPASNRDEASLHRAMVGRVRPEAYYRETRQLSIPADSATRLDVVDVILPGSTNPTSLRIAAGEILGVAGVEGSGNRELGAMVAGAIRNESGRIEVDGRRIRQGTVAAVAAGVAYVPRDRAYDGLILQDSMSDNIALPSWHDIFRSAPGTISRRRSRAATHTYREQLGIVSTSGVGTITGTLSGGNQQKLLLAKWLARSPHVLILDGPTQGVDSGARETIYDLIRDISDAGVAVLLISDDLPELIGLSHRVVVLVAGRLVADVPAETGKKPQESDIVSRMIPATSGVYVA